MMSAAIYIIVAAFKGTEQPDWTAIGVFAIGIAGIITGVGWNKVNQKKVEINGK